ncbi:hypothetical protein PtA15_17A52 [Puccinia triticina]|uniref:Uncharacterized protein n=1 Tax=Puccinia triticina TaxID=208348 RepID=A0ABY7D4N5_9BASI|nr:uncharacterized protein PtA15_17A52 [Puccinia triticina]WAQ92571.1 hypothetical protein PtA15_17A52 [Puccinia triticina]WAR63457.1 hypothetical protein PtB15_17B57 [Puccinia triticina]
MTNTQAPSLAPTTLTAKACTQKKKNKKRKSAAASSKKNCKGKKKANPEDFYIKSAKVSYMKELRELGLEYPEIKKAVDEEFPAIPEILTNSKEDESDSDANSS